MKNTNFLAGMFVWIREVIESAETPFVKFAIFVLPVLSPIVPASVTGIRLNTELNFHPVLCVMTALVLEMLGYVGAITFIRSIYKWFQKRGSFLSLLLGGASYGFYVFAMYSINVRLGTLAGDDPIVSSVFAILSFLTIPTGLLAAEHINERGEQEEAYRVRQENRQDRMERYKIKHANERTTTEQRTSHRTNKKRTNAPNEQRTKIANYVRSIRENEQRTPGPTELANVLGVSKSYASETLHSILQEIEEHHEQ